MKELVKIQILGPLGSGKTVLMRIIEKALMEAQVEVSVVHNLENTTPETYVLDAEHPSGLHYVREKVKVEIAEVQIYPRTSGLRR